MTLFGSAERWLTLTWRSAGLAVGWPGTAAGELDVLRPEIPMPADGTAVPLGCTGPACAAGDVGAAAGAVLTVTLRPPESGLEAVGGDRPGSASVVRAWSSEVSPSRAAETAATAPTAPSATTEVTACRTGRDLCRARGRPSGPRGGSAVGTAKCRVRVLEARPVIRFDATPSPDSALVASLASASVPLPNADAPGPGA